MRLSPPHRTLYGLLCGRLLCCVQDKDGRSAIMHAARWNKTEAVKALIAGKADLNLQVHRWRAGRALVPPATHLLRLGTKVQLL